MLEDDRIGREFIDERRGGALVSIEAHVVCTQGVDEDYDQIHRRGLAIGRVRAGYACGCDYNGGKEDSCVQSEHRHPGNISHVRCPLLAGMELRSGEVHRRGAQCASLFHQSREEDCHRPGAGGDRIGSTT